MTANEYFNAGETQEFVPQANNTVHQAVHALRGYAYQCVAAALEWVDISENGRLYLEVAEDYATLADNALHATQVKDTKESGAVTLNSTGVCKAITAFVNLVEKNPGIDINLHFMTTSEISRERALADRPSGMAGLTYWDKVAAGAPVGPLRAILESEKFGNVVGSYCRALNDSDLRDSLIKKIRWQCGKLNYAALREELESRLIVIGRDYSNISSEEAQRLADHLICRVLETSIIDDPVNRVLTRADLYKLIDNKNRTSVPNSYLESLLQLNRELVRSFSEQNDLSITGSAVLSNLFIDGDTLPFLQQILTRPELETSVAQVLSKFGVCILAGGSGVGKSVVARRIAPKTSSKFFIVDCKDMDAVVTRARLNSVFSRLGGLSDSTLILEDLNHLDDSQVAFAFGQVTESVLRRGRKLLVTCYRAPSLSTLSAIGLDQTCIIECPYFTEEETRLLVESSGGDPESWGRIAFFIGQSGHPQLTHAFVIGTSGRGWPIEEFSDVIRRGLSSKDTEAVRSSVRLSLMRDLSDTTRNLLYRLSFMVGHFKKSFALSIASISPEIPRPGESMDQLVGQWIEISGEGRYRISPLASGVGREILTLEEQKSIHKKIAEEYLKQDRIDAFDINSVTMHAIAAEWSAGLAMIAGMVIAADQRILGGLAEHDALIRFFRTDRPIYPSDRFASTVLRLVQFILATETIEQSDVSGIVGALFNEVDALPSGEMKETFEALALLKLITTLGIAQYVDNWVDLLVRAMRIVEQNELIRGIVAEIKGVTAGNNSIFFGHMFTVGSSNIASVKQLENIIDQLDVIDNHSLDLLLTPVDEGSSDYSVLINAPWATEQHSEEFDAADAEIRYARMAEKTFSWGKRSLTSQCWAARSILLNEYLNNKENALSVLAEAVETLGRNPIIDKARATVYWHQGEYKSALDIYRNIANYIGEDDPTERTITLRKAAICAAKCGEWLLAEEWFLDAQQAAACLDGINMIAMAIGLGADASATAFSAGDTDRALTRFKKSVDALENLDPADSLAAAYCHRIIRHAVLWIKLEIKGPLGEVNGKTINLDPGSCSNPDPQPAIQELPLGHIDCTWYMLAESEVSANADVGINSSLNERLTEGIIPQLELSLRTTVIQKYISDLNTTEFAEHFTKYIETTVFYRKNTKRLKSTFDVVAPTRENILALDSYASDDPVIEQVAREAVLGFGIHAIIANQSEQIIELETVLADYFGNFFPGKSIFDYTNGGLVPLTEQDQVVAELINTYLQKGRYSANDFCLAGLRFYDWINQSNFRNTLMLSLSIWLRSGWNSILEREKFQIVNPSITIPPVVDCLENSENNRSFVAELLLVSSDAVGVRLSSAYRKNLVAMKKAGNSITRNAGNQQLN